MGETEQAIDLNKLNSEEWKEIFDLCNVQKGLLPPEPGCDYDFSEKNIFSFSGKVDTKSLWFEHPRKMFDKEVRRSACESTMDLMRMSRQGACAKLLYKFVSLSADV